MLIMICMPIGGGVIKARTHEDYVGLWDFTTAMFRTAPYRGTQLGRVQLCGPYVSANRQRMADGALDAGADALMWLDADQTFPKETILRLLKHDLPIVGATYRKREAPLYQFMLPCLDGKIQEDRDVVDNLAYLPGGCHLVRKEVYGVALLPRRLRCRPREAAHVHRRGCLLRPQGARGGVQNPLRHDPHRRDRAHARP